MLLSEKVSRLELGAKKKKRSGMDIGGGAGERNDIDYMMIFIQDDLS